VLDGVPGPGRKATDRGGKPAAPMVLMLIVLMEFAVRGWS
jgi:hypothetical protein